MEGVIANFFKGWMNSANMENPEWRHHWAENARKAENENCQLVIFKIQNGKNSILPNSAIIEEIEILLQEKFLT